MKKYDKEIMQAQLDNEKAVLKQLESNYNDALEEINSKIANLMGRADADMQHVIYQVEYQKALKKQIEGILLQLQTNEFDTVSEYLTKCYEEGFIGTMYSMQSQGVPLVFPINQEEVVAAIQHETALTKSLYEAFDIKDLQKKIAGEISRGFSTGALFKEVARNVQAVTGISKNKAMRIARTEGHRITETAAHNAQIKAKERGADIVKIWDAALDSKTRPSHVRVDGEIKEVEEKFSNGLMFPGDSSGKPEEVINCRCRSRTDARWALEADETKMLGDTSKMTDEQKKRIADKLGIPVEDLDLYSGQIVPINAKSYADFKRQYNQLWRYEGSALQQEAEARIAKMEAKRTGKVAETPKPTIEDINAKGSQILGNTYEKHRTKNGLTSVPYDELGDSVEKIVSANYGKMSSEAATVFNDTISELTNEYDTPLQRIRTMTRNEFVGNSSSFAFVAHDYTVDSAELVINPAKCKDLDELTDRIKELSKRGYCVKIPDEVARKYVATHEFAHTLINLEQPLKNSTNWLGADYDKIRKARKEINGVYERYMSDVEVLTKKNKDAGYMAIIDASEETWKVAREAKEALEAVKLSDYSLQSADEFMAEAFANEKLGVSSNPYSKAVLDILDKYFKG